MNRLKSCAVYSSKTYSLTMLGVVLAFWAGYLWSVTQVRGLPLIWSIPVGCLLGLGTLALIHSLVSSRPVLQIDEAGIRYFPRWYPLIEWPDVAAVERMPKVVQTIEGVHSHLRDDWRPLLLYVRHPEKYLQRVPVFLRNGFRSAMYPDCARFQIDFAGLRPGSGAVYESIQGHLARRARPVSPAGS